MDHKQWGLVLAGAAAGIVNGMFGAGGGMILVPLLGLLTALEEKDIFTASLSIILPVCIVSLVSTALTYAIPWREALPYLFSSALGGLAAGKWGQKIPTAALHRGLGLLIIWGGIRYLW